MTWLDSVLESEYSVLRVLKKNTDKSIIVYRHKRLNKEIICRRFKGDGDVYRRLQKIKSDNLSEIYSVNEENGMVTVLEEYVDGITVGEVLSSGLYTENGARAVINEICDALSALHSLGIVHRDIKPENVMVTNDGKVKLIDFDAARVFKFGKSEDTKIIGTVGYAAPEQFGVSQSDGRTDIFALGVLMNVMLTGEHPGKNMYKGKLSKVIDKAVQLDPKKRYACVEDLKKFL